MINREASDKTKGFRLQKLRAVKLMLDASKLSDSAVVYWAIEHIEDVYENAEGQEYLEEDKNYDKSSSFTFNTQILRNTLVSFIDIWFAKKFSSNLKLGFYSTNKIGKEQNSQLTKQLSITLPKESLIKCCSELKFDEPDFLDALKKFMLYEYDEQYKKLESSNIDTLKKWDDEDWKNFLKIIKWEFGQPDEEKLECELLEEIKRCKWYSASSHEGKEEFILARLIDLLDKRQNKKDFLERFVYVAEVQNTFLRLKDVTPQKQNDPIWQMWDKIPVPTDTRNLEDKLTSVCNSLSQQVLSPLVIKATEGGIERQNYEDNKDFLSMRYRVYSKCKEKLNNELNSLSTNKLSESEVHNLIETLKNTANSEIDSFKESFQYPIVTETIISNIILELFDSCYLAMDDYK